MTYKMILIIKLEGNLCFDVYLAFVEIYFYSLRISELKSVRVWELFYLTLEVSFTQTRKYCYYNSIIVTLYALDSVL